MTIEADYAVWTHYTQKSLLNWVSRINQGHQEENQLNFEASTGNQAKSTMLVGIVIWANQKDNLTGMAMLDKV